MNISFQTIYLLLASNNGIQMSRFKHHTKINLIVYMNREIVVGLIHLHHLFMAFNLSLNKMKAIKNDMSQPMRLGTYSICQGSAYV